MNLKRAVSLWSLIAACLTLSLPVGAQTTSLYDNTTTDLSKRFDPGTSEVGNQVILTGGQPGVGSPAIITEFSFQYWGLNLGPAAEARVRFYANDGPAWDANNNMPGGVFYDSGNFSIASTTRNVLSFDSDFGTGLTAPGNFTYTVQFSNLGPGATAGTDLYSPPTVGASYDDFWYNNGTTWELRATTDGTPARFASEIQGTSVPEPGTALLCGLGLALVCLRYRYVGRSTVLIRP